MFLKRVVVYILAIWLTLGAIVLIGSFAFASNEQALATSILALFVVLSELVAVTLKPTSGLAYLEFDNLREELGTYLVGVVANSIISFISALIVFDSFWYAWLAIPIGITATHAIAYVSIFVYTKIKDLT